MDSKQCETSKLIPIQDKEDLLDIQDKDQMINENRKHNDENLRKLWIATALCLVFMIIEIIGGYLAHSIAIMADAAHMLSDVLGFLISIVSIYISRRQATLQMSYGYHRAEVIGALVSVNIIWGLTMWLLYEATLRLIRPGEVNGLIMLITAGLGFIFNIIMGVVLAYEGIDHKLHSHDHSHAHDDHNTSKVHEHKRNMSLNSKKSKNSEKSGHSHDDDHSHDHSHDHGHGHDHSHSHDHGHDHSHSHDHGHNHNKDGDINLRAAFIHVIGDALQNLGVVLAGVIIYFYPNLSIADPICTFIFSLIIVITTIRILKECIAVLMEGSPVDYNIEKLSYALTRVKHVKDIHDLHVWSLSVGKLSLSCHMTSTDPQTSLKEASRLLRNKFGINHFTLQVEAESTENSYDCSHDLH